MQIIARRTLKAFWDVHPDAETPLVVWFKRVEKADWSGPQDVKDMFGSADFVADDRVIFNIGGNKYRLIVRVSYPFKRVMIKFIGTHKEYDKINPETV
ncbi:type II toxin-antitoxin system HigB family toxin [Methylopila musalis]|uniref:Type II toxin-antitoxin system HigB family toxin n=1 Tax=Methylopila musalis TaxID=1134781 RepID=A0ABW3ZAD4_9HYPH